jgi:signal transduction histidine kinase
LLHPPLLDEAGLPSALQGYVDEFAQRSGINVTLECDRGIGRLPSELETAIFRVVQECLGNVHRHSSSQTATVRLNQKGDQLLLQIIDEGRGISDDKQRELVLGRGGVGLRGIRERVARFGGELNVRSNGEGTAITATLPRSPASFSNAEVA